MTGLYLLPALSSCPGVLTTVLLWMSAWKVTLLEQSTSSLHIAKIGLLGTTPPLEPVA